MMDKQQAMTTILDELHNYAFAIDREAMFDSDALDAALKVFDEVIGE